MAINRDDVAYTARLAKLELTEAEIERFCADLTKITEYVAQLMRADSSAGADQPVLPLVRDAQALREDVVEPPFDVTPVLKQAPDRNGNLFRVPKVLG